MKKKVFSVFKFIMIVIIIISASVILFDLWQRKSIESPLSKISDITVGKGDDSMKIEVSIPSSGSVIKTPVVVKGSAGRMWFSNTQIPIEVTDIGGKVFGLGVAKSESIWLTSEMIPFVAEIDIDKPPKGKGFLVFKREINLDNGLPFEFKIPVLFD